MIGCFCFAADCSLIARCRRRLQQRAGNRNRGRPDGRKLTLMRSADVLKTYHVALESTPIGPKQLEGDGGTPAGRYAIDSKNARSHNRLALQVCTRTPLMARGYCGSGRRVHDSRIAQRP